MISTYNRLMDRVVRYSAEHPLRALAVTVAVAALLGILSSLVTR